jgi:hypothetical protein
MSKWNKWNTEMVTTTTMTFCLTTNSSNTRQAPNTRHNERSFNPNWAVGMFQGFKAGGALMLANPKPTFKTRNVGAQRTAMVPAAF